MTSESNSVASITYVAMLSWALNASMTFFELFDRRPIVTC